MKNLVIPDDAVKFILFQRTQYLKIANSKPIVILRRLIPLPIYNIVVNVEGVFFKKTVIGRYNRDINTEFDAIKRHLPSKCSVLLDIGCGVAGICALLYQNFKTSGDISDKLKIYLLDKSKVEKKVWYNFEKTGAFYNSLSVAKKLLVENEIPSSQIILLEATDNNDIDIREKVDIVISFISWGFHYPVESYLDRVYEILADNGVLIIDVRLKTDGEKKILEKFSKVSTIAETEKFKRLIAKKQLP